MEEEMIKEPTKERILEVMALLNVNETEARFAIALEKGEISGDVFFYDVNGNPIPPPAFEMLA